MDEGGVFKGGKLLKQDYPPELVLASFLVVSNAWLTTMLKKLKIINIISPTGRRISCQREALKICL